MPAGEDGRLIVREAMLRYLEVYPGEARRSSKPGGSCSNPRPSSPDAVVDAAREDPAASIGQVISDGERRGTIDKEGRPEIAADLIVAAFEGRSTRDRARLGAGVQRRACS